MTQRELELELARITGESRGTIRQRGFSPMEVPDPQPLQVDWDALAAQRWAMFPSRRGEPCAA
jgi:hypothetical protein